MENYLIRRSRPTPIHRRNDLHRPTPGCSPLICPRPLHPHQPSTTSTSFCTCTSATGQANSSTTSCLGNTGAQEIQKTATPATLHHLRHLLRPYPPPAQRRLQNTPIPPQLSLGWYSGYSYLSGAYTVSCSLDTDLWVDLGPAIPDVVGTPGITGGPPPVAGEEDLKEVEERWFKIEAKDIVRGRVLVFETFGVCFSGF